MSAAGSVICTMNACMASTPSLGRFLRELRARGSLANTWVVITADHGEHFGEHDHFGHGSSLYNEQTHVPLVLIPPLGAEGTGTDHATRSRGRRVADPVSLRDLPRTLSELLIPGADNPFPGRSLARSWSAEWARRRRARSLTTGRAAPRRRGLCARSVGHDQFRDR